MSDIRSRLADALREADSCLCHICRSQQAEKLSDVLLALPGIAIVDSEELKALHKENIRLKAMWQGEWT